MLAFANDVEQFMTKVDGKVTALKKGTTTFKTSNYSNKFYTLDAKKLFTRRRAAATLKSLT